jgi:PAS domain S-box-containing protein
MRLADVEPVLDAMPDAIVVVDGDGIVRFLNHQAETLFGYQRLDVVGRAVEVLVPPASRELHPALRAGFMEQPAFRSMGAGRELSARRADGTTFPAEISLSPIETDEGTFVSAAVRDASERRRAAVMFRGLFEAAPDAMVGVDRAGRIVMVNSQAERLFAYPREELIGQLVEVLVPEAVRDLHPGHRERYLSAPATRPMGVGLELSARRADGTEFPAEISLATLDSGDGPIVTAAVRDVSERKRIQAERELLQSRQSERLESLGQLAGGIAHDFNNLLALILSYGRFVAKRVADDPGLSDDVAEILSAAERAAALTRQLLIFGRREVVRPVVLDLNDVMLSMEKLLRRTIGEHIELHTELASDEPTVVADPGQLEQVIVNLALNARDAMPGGGSLHFRIDRVPNAGAADGDAPWFERLTVSDTGQGMPPEVRNRIFEPFFSTKPKGEGTGLGLSTVYAIVTQAGGRIDVYSEEGNGTVFKVLLPGVRDAAQTTRRDVEHEPPRGDGLTVLVAEDEPGVREMTARILGEHGYRVVQTTTAAEALELCRSGVVRPNVLVTDVVMPGMSGRELAEAIGPHIPGLPVVYMSGYSHEVIAHQGVLEPGVLLVEKPFTDAQLLHAVGTATSSDGARAQDPTGA